MSIPVHSCPFPPRFPRVSQVFNELAGKLWDLVRKDTDSLDHDEYIIMISKFIFLD